MDKNTYIASYVHDICNSCNYVYTNRWKLNSNLVWIPKSLNNMDKNAYIASYIHHICNSCNYVYTNRWKLNSNWVWIPKG